MRTSTPELLKRRCSIRLVRLGQPHLKRWCTTARSTVKNRSAIIVSAAGPTSVRSARSTVLGFVRRLPQRPRRETHKESHFAGEERIPGHNNQSGVVAEQHDKAEGRVPETDKRDKREARQGEKRSDAGVRYLAGDHCQQGKVANPGTGRGQQAEPGCPDHLPGDHQQQLRGGQQDQAQHRDNHEEG